MIYGSGVLVRPAGGASDVRRQTTAVWPNTLAQISNFAGQELRSRLVQVLGKYAARQPQSARRVSALGVAESRLEG